MYNSYYGDKNKWFVGFVVEVIDESFVRVRIFGVHNIEDRTRLPDQDLPPALVIYPTTGGQSGSGTASHNITVDSWVIGFFADGDDCQFPVVTGVINGTDFSMSTYATQGGSFVGQPIGGQSIGDQSIPGVDPNATTNIPGGSNVEKVYNYIYDRLVKENHPNPHLATSAAVGVLQLESGKNLNAGAVNPSSGAYGIAQWLDRKSNLFRRTGSTSPNLAQQLDFMWWELNNTERPAKRRWLQATNIPDAVAGFSTFERAEEWRPIGPNGTHIIDRSHGNYKKRLQYAYEIYNSMSFTGQQVATTPTPPMNAGMA